MNDISKKLQEHYSTKFDEYGPTSMGVDWGNNQSHADLRSKKILELIKKSKRGATLLDVGCGYGALVDHIPHDLDIIYYGVDIASNMIEFAQEKHKDKGTFYCADFFSWRPPFNFDYVICNGILTQKLQSSHLDMFKYSQELVKKMYLYSNQGIAFNCMSTFVNYQKDNLFYRNPSEFTSWCMAELSPSVILDSSYELWYEYMIYVYRRLAPKA